MDRRAFLGLAGGLLTAPLAAEAQPAGKVRRIGILGAAPPTTHEGRVWEAFHQGLRDLGYVEGQNIVIVARYYEGNLERLVDFAAELVRLKVELIVVPANQPVHVVRRVTTTIPIVMTGHSDPVGSGLVASLARPGTNITGLSTLHAELTAKRLEILREAVPRLARMAVLWNPTNQTHSRELSDAEAAARALGLQVKGLKARDLDDCSTAFSAMTSERPDALLVLGDTTFWFHRARIAELEARSRVPAMFAQREHPEAGSLMSYGVDIRGNLRRAATYVDRILKGANPADLPIEQPTKFELVINLKTAKALGLTIPPSLLQRADQVIE